MKLSIAGKLGIVVFTMILVIAGMVGILIYERYDEIVVGLELEALKLNTTSGR